MNPRVLAGALVAVLVAGAPGFARQDRSPQAPVPSRAMAREPGAADRVISRIVGTVWTAENTPIALARVRLRNMTTGRVDAAAVGDEGGQFTFSGIDGGPFVVEYVTEEDRVLAVGNSFVVAPGETVATFVRLGSKKPWYAGFFGNAAIAVVSGAAASGITALSPVQRRASPDRPQDR